MKKGSWFAVVVVALVVAGLVVSRTWQKARRPMATSAARANGSNAKAATLPDAPDVTFKDLNGDEVRLSQFRGKVVLVNFWATWCEPCRFEIPSLIQFQQKYGDRGFVVLGVAMDDEGKSVVEPFVRKEQWDVGGKNVAMTYPIALGNDDVAGKFGGLLGIPTSVLISRDGKIVKRIVGLVNTDYLSKEIEGLL
jgi:thiol-disulfide isomerase/thioredoxin